MPEIVDSDVSFPPSLEKRCLTRILPRNRETHAAARFI
jgi:hypothetical protein